jgi:signal transduction histidine kinase
VSDLQSAAATEPVRERWLFPALGTAGLAVATALYLFSGAGPAQRPITLALAVAALGWMWLWTGSSRNRTRLAIAFYLGLLVVGFVLAARSPAFFAYSWIVYPYAFTLFRGYRILIAVTAAATGQYAALLGAGVPTDTLVYILPVGIFVPVVIAGWIGATEDVRRRRDNAALAEANRRLESALAENAGLHELLVVQARETGRLDERRRLAGDIHDTLAQGLTGIITHVQAAERAGESPEQWRFHLNRVASLARDSLNEARRSVQALRPGPLEASHLPEAVADLARRWSQSHGVPVAVEVTGEVVPVHTSIEVTLFRAAQEALTNVAKHAGASRASLTLSYLDDLVLLDVRDDGAGFDPREAASGFGLTAMRERLLAVDGTLEVESGDGEGTAINASVPSVPAEGRP